MEYRVEFLDETGRRVAEFVNVPLPSKEETILLDDVSYAVLAVAISYQTAGETAVVVRLRRMAEGRLVFDQRDASPGAWRDEAPGS